MVNNWRGTKFDELYTCFRKRKDKQLINHILKTLENL
jgi:hypothetical protein